MKKAAIILFIIISIFICGCKNSSSEKTNSEINENVVKCPHCGSQSLTSLEPGGRILECNECGVGFQISN